MGTLKKPHLFRDLSLRTSYVFYTLVTFLIATMFCSLIINTAERERSYLVMKYQDMATTYSIPKGGEYKVSYGSDITYTIYDAYQQVVEEFTVEYGEESVYTTSEYSTRVKLPDLLGDNATGIIVVPVYSKSDKMWDVTLTVLQTSAIPLCYGVGAILSAMYFFRRKLKVPLAVLTNASSRIAQNELDFTISYDSLDEMGVLCYSFETMRNALYKNNREMFRQMEERRHLNAAFSHDLRTPLTVLKGHADMILASLSDESFTKEELYKEVTVMSSNIRRLENYAEAMAKLQRLEDVEIRPTGVTPDTFLSSLRSAAEILCEEHTLSWQIDTTLSLWQIDPEIVMEVCENILSNASRFAKSKVSITVSDQKGKLCIIVSDDGCGFSVRALEQAGSPFYKARENADDGHLGFGLNICRILCARHGGELSLSNNGRGGGLVCATFQMQTI